MTTSTNGDNMDRIGSSAQLQNRENSIDITMLGVELRKDKPKAKSNFTRAETNLLLMVKYQNLPSRSGVWDACHNINMCMEIVMELLSNCTTFYIKSKEIQKEIQKANVVVSEMEKIERDFTSRYCFVVSRLAGRGQVKGYPGQSFDRS